MQQILLIVQILICLGLVALVLLQQGRGADAGASFGGGSSGSLFGSRGPASFLSKLTAGLAALFFANSLALAYISSQSIERRSVVERVQSESSELPAEKRRRAGAAGRRGFERAGRAAGPGVGSDELAEVVELVDTLS